MVETRTNVSFNTSVTAQGNQAFCGKAPGRYREEMINDVSFCWGKLPSLCSCPRIKIVHFQTRAGQVATHYSIIRHLRVLDMLDPMTKYQLQWEEYLKSKEYDHTMRLVTI